MRPLEGIKVMEMAGLAPAPYCGMLLSDFGADVVVVDRPAKRAMDTASLMKKNPFDRGKRSIRLDLKEKEGVEVIRKMLPGYDVLIEPFRPGVMEELGLGPEEALEINPGLVYARLTGWGQEGAYASMAGHDINYIALSGALSLFRRKGERPLPPCNLLADFAGGGMLCAFGILLALLERERSGRGQVVDSAMLDGAASFSTMFHGLLAHGLMTLDIGTNMLDTGSHFYETYETADGKFMSVGAIEAKFYAQLLDGLGLDPSELPHQFDMAKWPEMKEKLARVFKTKTRDEWAAVFDGKDACVAPILDLNEVAQHPHNRARNLIIDVDGIPQPAPAPRLSRTPGQVPRGGRPRGTETREVLAQAGFSDEEIQGLLDGGVVEEAGG
ncbi:MAG: CoA transferase [Deltaproteobacteria bacterium]|nr:CoA transferase [Deltaproteobacteria bacterium]MBW1923957.1 CoA transferase [Deltaproteobacteria bacterium]MBW2009855.1 CoA transferase [Deltaproteobacteria bacterium]MBW2101691.1 CoA transferase [Deltaproteobacteria bacterium]MBW2346875.1 CoA transferase [Deltaproteobacteria bacterium]